MYNVLTICGHSTFVEATPHKDLTVGLFPAHYMYMGVALSHIRCMLAQMDSDKSAS